MISNEFSTQISAYGLDVGVYNLGTRGQVLNSTTTAWVRVNECPVPFLRMQYNATRADGAFQNGHGSTFHCGRDIIRLAEMVATDLNDGRRIAIGFEAPMWIPIYGRLPVGRFSLFKPRFPAEAGHEWYLQAGAAASLKALSLGHILFCLLPDKVRPLVLTTDFRAWLDRPEAIFVFEGFVAGDFKLSPPDGVPVKADNEWDAFTTAAAFWARYVAQCDVGVALHKLHGAQSWEGDVSSLWATIAHRAGLGPIDSCDGDCEILGLFE